MAESSKDTEIFNLASVPSPKRTKVNVSSGSGNGRKYSDAALYQSSFQARLQKRWPCVVPVTDNLHSFWCTLYSNVVSCGHQGERDVTHHIASAQHQLNAKILKGTAPLRFVSQAQQVSDKVNY